MVRKVIIQKESNKGTEAIENFRKMLHSSSTSPHDAQYAVDLATIARLASSRSVSSGIPCIFARVERSVLKPVLDVAGEVDIISD